MKRLIELASMALLGTMLLQLGCKNSVQVAGDPEPLADVCIDKDKINPSAPCIKIYRPVCGCDGKTYSNSCMADKAGVISYTEGACKE